MFRTSGGLTAQSYNSDFAHRARLGSQRCKRARRRSCTPTLRYSFVDQGPQGHPLFEGVVAMHQMLGHDLNLSAVCTSLALFTALIAPLKSFLKGRFGHMPKACSCFREESCAVCQEKQA